MEVIVNAAMSADGKLSSVRREQLAISGPDDFERVDRLRRSVDAIMVGIGTVLADDPSLTVDDPGDGDPLTRVILDSAARTPPDARVLAGSAPTLIVTTDGAPDSRIRALEQAGATVTSHGTDRVDLRPTLDALEATGTSSLLVEGGGEVIFSCFDAGAVDRLLVFVGPVVIGGREAPTLADGAGFVARERFPSLRLADVDRLDEGVVLDWVVDEAAT